MPRVTSSSQIVDISPSGSIVSGLEEQRSEMPDAIQTDDKKIEPTPTRQDVFGDETHAEVKYKVLKWWQCGLLMVAETISLGILSLPAAIANLGFVPAIIILISLGLIASYTGYVIGQFKWRYPHISSMADAGEMLMGPFGRELLFVGQMLFLVFLMASHILTFTVAMNTLTNHGTCSIVFGIVGLIVSLLMSLPRTLAKMSWLSLASFISIFTAVMIAMIAIGIQKPEAVTTAINHPSLVTGVTSALNIALSYASHNAFFNIIAELKDPKDFPKALSLLQCIDISLYLVCGIVIYRYAGEGVESPALGSAGPVVGKIAYGIALPTILIAGVINGHIACKSIYTRVFAGTDRMHKRDFVAVGSWIGIAVALWVVAWVIASAIPVFSDLLSLMTALFASWFSFGLPGAFWLYMNKDLWFSSPKKILLTLLNTSCICIGIIMCGLGLYSSGKAVHDNPSSQSFSCANTA
ncbi:transmembrane amino acid transporter protein-domain-containing protein [Aspergillus novoparasiticus]|uniref:Transmembrane amino acid transporter protein-domain-containing protein n=1 Tax=Aspergillus novoparasiticus TaxID=986946 RepID=A0A5N6F453_9EURO|nr:transmembrane amino acid transporter protein-domain-containing protein [Aspergillus novoparasiticus]